MRVLNQISVTTTRQASERIGKKYVLATIGTTDVLIAFSYRLHESPETDFKSFTASELWKFTAPKGKKIWYVFCKTASGTSTLDLTVSDMDMEKIA